MRPVSVNYYTEEDMKEFRKAFENEVLSWPDVDSRKMFGCPSYRAKGTLFGLLVTGGLVLTKLDESERATLSSEHKTRPFQANRRIIRSWIQVDIAGPSDLDELLPFVRRSFETALIP
jgi:hypothetical protein